ncbi:phosphopentomutase [Fructilactobacillus frigidiflavus]|uniref:phosphopentomutase n=1 Tax=Fructilactobacillus frigidiflavus TaxID=3242688 RepID=UPI0037574DE9
MSYKRVILVDLAALGLRSDNESAQHNSDNDTILTHVLNQSSDFALPALHKLGFFNVFFNDNEEVNPQIAATYGLTRTRCIVNKPCSGLREMFDCSLSYRVSSVFEETAKQTRSIIISKFVSYLFSQELSDIYQVSTDEEAFAELDHQLEKNDAGFFYTQLPQLQELAEADDFDGFSDELAVVDHHLANLMNNLRDDDLLMVVSSRIGDNRSRDGFSTYKILPVMIHDNASTCHHFTDEPYVCEVGATVLAAMGLQDQVVSPKHSLLPCMK